MSTCGCYDSINEQLAVRNARIKQIFVLDGRDTMPWPIATEQIESGRGKPKAPMLFASYCPFCGVSLKGADHAN